MFRSGLVRACEGGNSKRHSFVAAQAEHIPTVIPLPRHPSLETITFGHYFTPHILQADWSAQLGWGRPYFTDFKSFQLSPSISALQYGLTCFEGLKAYYSPSHERIHLFRPEKNAKRMLQSSARLTLPGFDVSEFVEMVKLSVRVARDWVPKQRGYSLYIRPSMISTDPYLGVHQPCMAKFYILMSPVGPYYATGLKPVKLLADEVNRRAWPGGTGMYKIGGNYGPTLYLQREAAQKGCQQVLWLGPNNEVTEVGAMNIFFVFRQKSSSRLEVVTAPLDSGMVLPGVTRDSILTLLRSRPEQYEVSERTYTMNEVLEALKGGDLVEVFGSGTAALVSLVNCIRFRDEEYMIPCNEQDGIAAHLLKEMNDIYYGVHSNHEWLVDIDAAQKQIL